MIAVFVFWGAVFLLFFQANDRSPSEFVCGGWEPWPQTLGSWTRCETPERALQQVEGGVQPLPVGVSVRDLAWERRLLAERSWLGQFVIVQERARDRTSREIVYVFPEQKIRRKRQRSSET